MRTRNSQTETAFTLIELLVVVAIVGMLAALTAPMAADMVQSYRRAAITNTIRAALRAGKARAATTQKYAGIRFQQSPDGTQYAVIIDKANYDTNTYYAAENIKPVALPAGLGVISGELGTINNDPDRNAYLDSSRDVWSLDDATTFSIIFSPTGQLVVKNVRVQPRPSGDTTFGNDTATFANPPLALLSFDDGHYDFDQEQWFDDSSVWCLSESSTTSLYIYDQGEMDQVDPGLRYTDYASSLEPILINMYTGQIIEDY